MSAASTAVDAAISEVTKLRAAVGRLRTKQVRGSDDLAVLSATAWAWFKSHRPIVQAAATPESLTKVDSHLQAVLDATSRAATRGTYLFQLQQAKDALIDLRATLLTPAAAVAVTDDVPPDFSALAGNPEMREILTRRWRECHKCVSAEAHLAAIVMMGGLLEALFVARANKMPDKAPLTRSPAAPKDRATGKTINYQEWMLDSYIKVGCELGWITDSARQLADVLKEYRNYIHPAKELRHKVELAHNDSNILWQVTKGLVRQLLASAGQP